MPRVESYGGSSEFLISGIIHTSFDDGLSDEEFDRIQLQTGETLEVTRVECRIKGGGSNASFSIKVYDDDDSSTIDSANAGSTSTTGGTSTSGALITFLISNSTGSAQVVSYKVYGVIS